MNQHIRQKTLHLRRLDKKNVDWNDVINKAKKFTVRLVNLIIYKNLLFNVEYKPKSLKKGNHRSGFVPK